MVLGSLSLVVWKDKTTNNLLTRATQEPPDKGLPLYFEINIILWKKSASTIYIEK